MQHLIWLALFLVGLGSLIENTGRPGSLAVAHLFYGWGIIGAIMWHAYISATAHGMARANTYDPP
jgi:hypothetical protein